MNYKQQEIFSDMRNILLKIDGGIEYSRQLLIWIEGCDIFAIVLVYREWLKTASGVKYQSLKEFKEEYKEVINILQNEYAGRVFEDA